jgi:hypothetical protein
MLTEESSEEWQFVVLSEESKLRPMIINQSLRPMVIMLLAKPTCLAKHLIKVELCVRAHWLPPYVKGLRQTSLAISSA